MQERSQVGRKDLVWGEQGRQGGINSRKGTRQPVGGFFLKKTKRGMENDSLPSWKILGVKLCKQPKGGEGDHLIGEKNVARKNEMQAC